MNFDRSESYAKVTLATLVCLLAASPLLAQTESRWIAEDGNWSDVGNWDNGVPSATDVAIIEANAGNINQDIDGLTLNGLVLNSSTANIDLQNDLLIEEFLTWDDGKLRGNAAVILIGTGQINGGTLETTFENFGFVEFGSNEQAVNLASETGGHWINRSGSLTIASSVLVIGNFVDSVPGLVTIESNSTLQATAVFQSTWDVVNHGDLQLEQSFGFFFGDFSQSENATLNLENGGADFFQITDLSGIVSGTGTILNLAGPFDVQFDPGGSQIGAFETGGLLSMTAETVSNFQIGPDLTSDRLSNIGGPLQLNGTLNIQALPGVTPGTYTLFTYNNAFMLQVDNIVLGDVPAGFVGSLVHDAPDQSVNLVVDAIDPVILGDINRDGSVNLLDVNPFIALLSSGEFQVEADINGDGLVNLIDVSGFIELLAG